MNGIYTVEELGLGRDKESHIDAVAECLIAEDIVIYGDKEISSDMILETMSSEFKRRLVHLAIDSQNPISRKVRNQIEEAIFEAAHEVVNSVKVVF